MSGERQVQVLYDESTIAERTEALAGDIAAVQPKELLVVAILKGSFMFAADLLRALHRAGLDPHVEFFHLSSYMDGTVSSGTVKILRDIESLYATATSCSSTISSNWAAPWRSPKTSLWPGVRAGSWSAPCSRNPGSGPFRSKPTSSVSSVQMCLLSATVWMSRIPIASCRSSDGITADAAA